MKEMKKDPPATIDEYIAQCPENVQQIMRQIRSVIKETAPQAEERISYQMPAFYWKGYLVYFAPRKDYIGFYPTGSGIEAFKDEISGYKSSKGAVQFPFNQPMPFDLIRKMVKFKMAENEKRPVYRKNKE